MRDWLRDILSFVVLVIGGLLFLALAVAGSFAESWLGEWIKSIPWLADIAAVLGGAILLATVVACVVSVWRKSRPQRRPRASERPPRQMSRYL